MKSVEDAGDELAAIIERAARHDDGAIALEHLKAGFPIYYTEISTPAGMLVKEHPGGSRELIRVDLDGLEHHVQPIA